MYSSPIFWKKDWSLLFRPYVLAYEKYSKLRSFISQKLCILRHEPLLDYFSQFIQAYKDKPKMGWTWIVHIGHNNEWESQRLDPHLLDFLKKNKEEVGTGLLKEQYIFARYVDFQKWRTYSESAQKPALNDIKFRVAVASSAIIIIFLVYQFYSSWTTVSSLLGATMECASQALSRQKLENWMSTIRCS